METKSGESVFLKRGGAKLLGGGDGRLGTVQPLLNSGDVAERIMRGWWQEERCSAHSGQRKHKTEPGRVQRGKERERERDVAAAGDGYKTLYVCVKVLQKESSWN